MVLVLLYLDSGKSKIMIDKDEKELTSHLIKCINNFSENKKYISDNFDTNNNNFDTDNIVNFDLGLLSFNPTTNINKIINDNKLNFTNVVNIYVEIQNNSSFIDLSCFQKLKKINFKIEKNWNYKFYDDINEFNLLDSLKFNEKITNLPQKLKIIKLGDFFNNEIELSENLEELYFGENFNQYLNNLPSKLKILSFSLESEFNQPLINLPTGLKKLYLGKKFNHCLDFLPSGIEFLSFSSISIYDSPIDNLPTGLKILLLGENFKNSLNNLPNGIEELIIRSDSNIINKFPNSLKKLQINVKQIDKINLLNDYSINELVVDSCGNIIDIRYQLPKFKIPKSVVLLKSYNIGLSDNSWLIQYAINNSYVINRSFGSFTMKKNTNN